MAITFPRSDILTGLPFDNQIFMLFERQELSRTADGVTRAKSFGSAIWKMSCTSASLYFDQALELEAKLHSLDGAINRFYAHDLRRPYPKEHADGAFTDSGVILSVNANNKALALDDLPAGFQISPGDMLAFDYGATPSRALHQVVEAVTANGAGLTAEFEVRPHLRPGIVLSPSTEVVFKTPQALFAIEPGSVQSRLNGPLHSVISFSAVQIIE